MKLNTIIVVLSVCPVLYALSGDSEKRLLDSENYVEIIQRLDDLTSRVQAAEAKLSMFHCYISRRMFSINRSHVCIQMNQLELLYS